MARVLGSATLGLASETGFPPIGGTDAALLSFPAFGPGEALRIKPLPEAGAPIATWALGLDLYLPQPAGTFTSLLQTGGGDGDLFLRDNGDGTAAIGINGNYTGAIPYDTWVRLFVTFTEEGGTTILRTYLDGARISEQDVGTASRFAIDPASGLSLLADNDGETAAGALAGVFFTSELPSLPETEGAIAAVATPSASGFFPAQPSPAAIEITFDGEDIAPRYGDARVSLDGFGFESPAAFGDSTVALASQFGIDGPGGVDIAVLEYAAFSRDEGLKIELSGADLSTYTAVWDIRFDSLGGFQSLLQTDPAQTNDGELFIRSDGGIGINGNYDGAVVPGTWHRIAITVEDQGDGSAILSKYLDGAFLDAQTVNADRFTLNAATGAVLLSDNDGETGTGYLAHFGLTDVALDAAAIAALGGADGAGPFTAGTPVTLSFESSFRPFADMTGEVLVSFDGGAFTSLLTLDASTVDGGNSSLARINETISLDVLPPAGTTSVQFRFDYTDADNDWWWAIDDIAVTQGATTLLAEDFDGLSSQLQPAVDENIASDLLGWTHDAPAGWTRTVDAPQGTTEWQGWSFATPEFWLAADTQNRGDFTLGTGVIAIADGDEWNDFNGGSLAGNDFNTALTTPAIPLAAPATGGTYQLGFDGYAPGTEFGFSTVELLEPAAPDTARQDNIKDLLIRDDGTPTEIDLVAAFGVGATGFTVTAADGSVLDATITDGTLTLTGLTLGHSDITVTAQTPAGPAEENFRAIVAGENAYVFAIIPDTQDYTSNLAIAPSFGNMIDWIVAQKDSLAIEHAIHVGDIVQFGAVNQWQIAEDAMERLDGEVSYSLTAGNHDQQRPGFSSAFSFETDIDTYFTREQVGATAAQGGGTYDGFDVGEDTFANGDTYSDSIRNAYTTFQTRDGTNWLVFSLEFGMPDDVLRWAGEVIEDHLDHRVIINTHSWQGGDGRVTPTTEPLTTDNGGWGYAIRENPRNVNDGEDAWRELASKYPNMTFTFNGHNFMGGAETTVSYAAGGNPVFQTFVNYQGGANGNDTQGATNNGTLRLVVVDPDNDRLTTHTKITELDTFYDEFPDHEEVFEGVDLGTPEEIVIAKAGATQIVTGDGIAGAVTLDPSASLGDTTDARFEWFAADGEKLGESDGAPLDIALPTGTTRITLKVTDAKGNVSTDDTVVIVETPAPEAPLVIAHRGASADRPEHTLAAYQLAMENGADFVEPDLVSTKDGVLVARHEPWLATVQTDGSGNVVLGADGFPVVTFASTDIAEVAKTNADFMARLTTKNIGFSSDGLFGAVTGWFVEDFTLAELKTLRAVEDQPGLRPQSAAFDGQFEVPTLAEIIRLVKDFEDATGRKVGIYPETKEPSYFDSIGLSLEEKLIATLQAEGFTDPARVFIQSFEVANLLDLQENVMPAAGLDLPLVQLLFNAPTFPTYDLFLEAITGGDFAEYASLGYDAATVSGDFLTPEGLAKLAAVYAEGVGPTFSLVQNAGGLTDLVHDAQAAGLLVHAYTHRDEGGPSYETYLASGVNGIFTDNSDTGRAATDAALAAVPRLTETFDDGDLAGWGAPAGDPGDLAELGTDLGFALPSIGGVAQIPLTLRFDSSFRPFDDMTGEVLVSFDDGASFTTLLTLDTSTVPGGSSSLTRANEAVVLQTLAPDSAATAQFAFRLSEGGNDWWWAIDNVQVDVSAQGVTTVLLSEDFDALPLGPAVDENIDPAILGWTPTPPAGWDVENAALMPQGTTEWQGWTFATPQFWTSADGQNRSDFTRGTGVIAIADPDEWDDFGIGAGGGDFDSTLRSPAIDLTPVGGGQPSGNAAGVARVGALAPDEAILFRPEGLTGRIDSYTLVFDILLSPTTQSFTGLFQTDPTNAGDSEIYLRNDGATASIGISGNYDGALAYGAWGRVGLVFETDAAGQQTLAKYLDGVLLDTQVVDGNVSDGSRWSVNGEDGILLFSEGAGFTSEIYANAVYFAPEALDAATLSGFAGVDVDGPADASLVAGDVQLSFDDSLDDTDFGAATVEPLSLASPDATSYLVKGSIFGNPNGEGEAALYQQSNQADQHLIWLDEAARGWSDYVFTMVVEPADNDTIGALFYYVDDDSHYKLEINQQNDTRELIRVRDGTETVIASEAGGYRHFAKQDLSIAVFDGTITITLDDEMLFGGPVTDADPLAGGTVGLTTSFMDRVAYDNITVNPITLAARALTEAPSGKWQADLDGDGFATVALTAAASLSAAGIVSHEWLVDGKLVAAGVIDSVFLAPGDTTVTLRVTDAKGAVAEDTLTIHVADARAVLAADDFEDGDTAGWTFVDEGTLAGPSDWQVVNGALVQASDIASPQQRTGSTAYSVEGDGPYILRDGTYALWNDPEALAWQNYALEATLTPNDNDGIGLLFRYTDAENYYKMETDAETGIAMLTRHLDGRESILARGYVGYTEGEAQHWRIEADGGVLTPYIDGKAVFGTIVEDRTLPMGTIGLYGWASENLTFDNVVVTQLDYVAPSEITGTEGDDRIDGTSGADVIRSLGGRLDTIFAGGGIDTFVFGAETTNGVRETDVLSDYETGEIIDLGGVGVASFRELNGKVRLVLEGDGDVVMVVGVGSFDDLAFA